MNPITVTDAKGTRQTRHLFEYDDQGTIRCMRCWAGFDPKSSLARLKQHTRWHWKQIKEGAKSNENLQR
jgi:hypothetical protein